VPRIPCTDRGHLPQNDNATSSVAEYYAVLPRHTRHRWRSWDNRNVTSCGTALGSTFSASVRSAGHTQRSRFASGKLMQRS
jgi:hypothetical protein